jgi:dihydroorotate dehydrogenase
MIYKKAIRSWLFRQDPEASHESVVSILETIQESYLLRSLTEFFCDYQDPRLRIHCLGLEFSNPIGLAAGFDKNGRLTQVLPALGFGFIEVGTVTKRAQPGNPKPRIFRLPQDLALINRLGFNNDGADALAARLQRCEKARLPLGINIGKNKETSVDLAIQDYLYSFAQLFAYGDYFVVNVSSPNTPDLRKLQERGRLSELLRSLSQLNAKLATDAKTHERPILVKIAPDLSWAELDDVLTVIAETRVAGIIATNTTIERKELLSSSEIAAQAGGLSGAPLAERANEIIAHIATHTEKKLPIVGVGGVFTAEDALAKFRAGATLVQVYTGLIYEGPMIVKRINQGLVKMMQRVRARNVSELVNT